MLFEREKIDSRIVIRLSGNIIFEETSDLANYLDSVLAEDFEEAVLDFSGTTGINSSAIGKVIDFNSKLQSSGRKMRIQGMSEKAYTVFQYFKLDELFPIEKDPS